MAYALGNAALNKLIGGAAGLGTKQALRAGRGGKGATGALDDASKGLGNGAESVGKGCLKKPGDLGDDFGKAFDDIVGGNPRPNVRDPKPFVNDGRGGTPRLPGTDDAGNPIKYMEHTVNPRPPGGKLDGSRIITGSNGSAWATIDHFETWIRIQ